jgi:drug/metabolite transporter (DMT)-like permease
MSTAVFVAVLAAAAMHAAWNAMLKVRGDRFVSVSLMSVGMAVTALPFVPFVSVPRGETWGWIAASLVFHTGYKYFLSRAYETGDLALAYPLARGSAPLLATIGGAMLLAEVPGAVAIAGIVLLSCGVFLMSFRGGRALGAYDGWSVFFALVTSVFIAGYTLTDGSGARSAADATSYAVWLFLCEGVWSLAFCIALRGPRSVGIMLGEWKVGLVGGFLSAVAYWIAMWAMTKAPIATVAALRETSILFAMALSTLMLGEKLTRWRIGAGLLIVGGVIALRMG